jgi:hypothetical protein
MYSKFEHPNCYFDLIEKELSKEEQELIMKKVDERVNLFIKEHNVDKDLQWFKEHIVLQVQQ